jgi:glycosyltransferase involved in cell wall biosynthesis
MGKQSDVPPATIIVPLLRQEDAYLVQCIRSALDQTVACEVIVVRAAETPPRHLRILREFQAGNPRLRVVPRKRPGFAAALNTGIEMAAAPRIGILLSDDWLAPTAVEECLSRVADIVSTDIEIYDAAGRKKLGLRRPITTAGFESLDRLRDKASYLTHFFVFTKEALAAVGGVDEQVGLTGADDFDMIWSLLEIGATVSIVEKKLYHYRDHPGERLTLRDRALQIRDLEKVFAKHGVTGAEFRHEIERHARWFGRTILAAAQERKATDDGWSMESAGTDRPPPAGR